MEEVGDSSAHSKDSRELEGLRQPLRCLEHALRLAERSSRDLWQFAVNVRELREAGLSSPGLRFLIAMGYVDHAFETTGVDAKARSFRRAGNGLLLESSACVITDRGLELIEELESCCTFGGDSSSGVGTGRELVRRCASADEGGARPLWDPSTGRLFVATILVKRVRANASTQRALLDAFQIAEWQRSIEDPLRCPHDLEPERRLNNAVAGLNRGQKVGDGLVFHTSERGSVVYWEIGAGLRGAYAGVASPSGPLS